MQQQWTLGFWACISLVFIYISYNAAIYTGDALSPQGCRMSWMFPDYILQRGFNSSWTLLANRYSLWLYREGDGWETGRKLTGVPVLFVPGNAGSSRQARSIASSAARQYFSERGGTISSDFKNRDFKPLDVFTADFNEDFSALHEPTLLAQRQYILDAIAYITSLYANNTRIFLIGHSMGGIVTTSILPHSNVSGVITLSTPHNLPPARYSAGMEQLYRDIFHRLLPVEVTTPIISICGGATDLMIPSETCMLPNWPHPKNRKTLFSGAMEGCWAGVGHQVSVWCHQIRWRVARAILEAQESSDDNAFKIISQWLNDGIHSIASSAMSVDSRLNWEFRSESVFFIDNFEIGRKGYLLPIPRVESRLSIMIAGGKLLGQGAINAPNVSLEVFLCSGPVDAPICSSVKNSVVSLYPAVQQGQQFPMPGEGVDEGNAIALLQLDHRDAKSAEYFGLMMTTSEATTRTWLRASVDSSLHLEQEVSLWTLMWSHVKIPLSPNNTISHLKLDDMLESSILVYRVEADTVTTQRLGGLNLSPLLVHRTATERHIHPTTSQILLHAHSWGSFLPLALKASTVSLDVISPGVIGVSSMRIKIDLYASLGRAALRYYSATAAWSVGIVGSVLTLSWFTWQSMGTFPSFGESLSIFLRKYMVWISASLFIGSLLSTSETTLLGNGGTPILALIVPIVFITSCGLVCFSWILVNLILSTARSLRTVRMSSEDRQKQSRSLRRSFLHISLVSALILLLIPYQVVFLICFVIQWITCWALNGKATDRQVSSSNALNQNIHILMFFLWLLPNMVPSLVVWVRTMATAGSISLFNNDHWPHPVIPFLMVTEFANARSHSPAFSPSRNRIHKYTFFLSLCTIPAVTFLFGARYPYYSFNAAAVACLLLSSHAI